MLVELEQKQCPNTSLLADYLEHGIEKFSINIIAAHEKLANDEKPLSLLQTARDKWPGEFYN